jgi:hypothetical protein
MINERRALAFILVMLFALNSVFYITSSWAAGDEDEELQRIREDRGERRIREANEMAFSIIFWIILGGGSAYLVARGLRR